MATTNETTLDRPELAAFITATKEAVHQHASLESSRREAWDHLASVGLPTNKHEEYKRTPLTRALERTFQTTGQPSAAHIDLQPFLIPDIDSYSIVIINGIYSRELSTSVHTDGLIICSLTEAVEKYPDHVNEQIGSIAKFKYDAFVAWNTATWEDGVFIRVADKVRIEKPVTIYHINTPGIAAAVGMTRALIQVGSNADITIIEKFDTTGDSAFFYNRVGEVFVDENAGFNFYSIQNDSGKQFLFNQFNILQKNYSRVNAYAFTLNGEMIRNNLQLALDGEGCESHMFGLYLLDNNTLADNHTVVDHMKPNSFSNELYKGVMGGNSKGVFNGKIYVRPDAQKTNAFQSNRNILLTDKATVNTKPQLEIWADDVKCSHGCTTGQLDEEALFYLQTRGLSKDTARAMLLYAFAGEVIDTIQIEPLKIYLDQLVGQRLHKDF